MIEATKTRLADCDTRPRHIRSAEQLLGQGWTLRWGHMIAYWERHGRTLYASPAHVRDIRTAFEADRPAQFKPLPTPPPKTEAVMKPPTTPPRPPARPAEIKAGCYYAPAEIARITGLSGRNLTNLHRHAERQGAGSHSYSYQGSAAMVEYLRTLGADVVLVGGAETDYRQTTNGVKAPLATPEQAADWPGGDGLDLRLTHAASAAPAKSESLLLRSVEDRLSKIEAYASLLASIIEGADEVDISMVYLAGDVRDLAREAMDRIRPGV